MISLYFSLILFNNVNQFVSNVYVHLNKTFLHGDYKSLCFAIDEDGCAVENFCNTLFKCNVYVIIVLLIGT
jgi:hypothetical protein